MDFRRGVPVLRDQDVILDPWGAPLPPSTQILVRPPQGSPIPSVGVSPMFTGGNPVYGNVADYQSKTVISSQLYGVAGRSFGGFGGNQNHPITYSRRDGRLSQHQEQLIPGVSMQGQTGKVRALNFSILADGFQNGSSSTFPGSYSQVEGVSDRVYTRRRSGSRSGTACGVQVNNGDVANENSLVALLNSQSDLQQQQFQQQQGDLLMYFSQNVMETQDRTQTQAQQKQSDVSGRPNGSLQQEPNLRISLNQSSGQILDNDLQQQPQERKQNFTQMLFDGLQLQEPQDLRMFVNHDLSDRQHVLNNIAVTAQNQHKVKNSAMAAQSQYAVNNNAVAKQNQYVVNDNAVTAQSHSGKRDNAAQQIPQYDAFSSTLLFQCAPLTLVKGRRSIISEMIAASKKALSIKTESKDIAPKDNKVIDLEGDEERTQEFVQYKPQVLPTPVKENKKFNRKEDRSDSDWTPQRKQKEHQNISISRSRILPGLEASPALPTPVKENKNVDSAEDPGNDSNWSPQEKPKQHETTPKRKKHRPKVVVEGKPTRTPKPVTPNPVTPKPKRNNAKRNGNTLPMETTDTTASASVRTRSTRKRSINFNIEVQIGYESQHETVNHEGQNTNRLGSSSCKRVLNFSSDLQSEDLSKGNKYSTGSPSTIFPAQDVDKTTLRTRDFDLNQALPQDIDGPEDLAPSSPVSRIKSRRRKRNYSSINYMSSSETFLPGCESAQSNLEQLIAKIFKKKRTERQKMPRSVKTLQCAQYDWLTNFNSKQSLELISGPTSSPKKKRTTVPSRVRDFSGLIAVAMDCNRLRPTVQVRLNALDSNAKVTKNKRTTVGQPTTCPLPLFKVTRKEKSLYDVILDEADYQTVESRGFSEVIWPLTALDDVIRRLNRLQIDERNNHIRQQENNSIIPFDGSSSQAMVPYEGPFDSKKKRVAKVQLGQESVKEWKLLMGIGVEDKPKSAEAEKWWKDERQIYKDRAYSFITRMHGIQGDRTFSPWKGSIVDSVIGVFLTQNVSDHLSSSAFMELVANFPLAMTRSSGSEMGTQVIVEEPEENEKQNEKEAADGVQSSGSSNSEFRVEELSVAGDKWSSKDVVSSQNSGISTAFTFERIIACSDISSRADPEISQMPNSFEGSFSFVELLQNGGTAVLQNSYNWDSCYFSLSANINEGTLQSKNEEFEKGSCLESKDPSEEKFASINKSNSRNAPTPIPTILTSSDLAVLEKEFVQVSGESGLSVISEMKNDGDYTCQRINLMDEIVTETVVQGNKNCSRESSTVVGSSKAKGKKISKRKTTTSPKKSSLRTTKSVKAKKKVVQNERDWDSLRKEVYSKGLNRDRNYRTMDSLDWEGVRLADVGHIAKVIKARGMNQMLAERIKEFLNRLVAKHGSIDLEWLRDVPPKDVKDYLLSVNGLGLKSVECIRLLTLRQLAFPVDTNVARIAVRLGWVPIEPLPESLQLHLLELYPMLDTIQKHLWPRLCTLDEGTLYELHYQMITFGKVFCTKIRPNCNECPMKPDCKHFASAYSSARQALPAPEVKDFVASDVTVGINQYPAGGLCPAILCLPVTNPSECISPIQICTLKTNRRVNMHPEADMGGRISPMQLKSPSRTPAGSIRSMQLNISEPNRLERIIDQCEPIIEEPSSPEASDIEDFGYDDQDKLQTIDFDSQDILNISNLWQTTIMESQERELSKALISLTPPDATIPTPKLKNTSRLRTEHLVYELPDMHPLLKERERREPDDPSTYLLAIWTPGETSDSVQPLEGCCDSQELGKLCTKTTCFACNTIRETEAQIVRGTILIPCKTAMRGSFPLNGTYFQTNEVFADHESSLNPISVPRATIWNLPRRTVYFGTSVTSIFKGMTREEITKCFWTGFVCVRGFDERTRAPRPLSSRLHVYGIRKPSEPSKRASGKTEDSETPRKAKQ